MYSLCMQSFIRILVTQKKMNILILDAGEKDSLAS